MFALAMYASNAHCFAKLIKNFWLSVSSKKTVQSKFKANVELCWNKWRLNLKVFIVTFLIMVLFSHLSNSSSLFFRFCVS